MIHTIQQDYYYLSPLDPTIIIYTTDVNSKDYMHDIYSMIVYPSIPNMTPFKFSTNSHVANTLIPIGSTQADLDSFIQSNPEYFI